MQCKCRPRAQSLSFCPNAPPDHHYFNIQHTGNSLYGIHTNTSDDEERQASANSLAALHTTVTIVVLSNTVFER